MTSIPKTLSVLILVAMTMVACSGGGADSGSSGTESAVTAPVRFADCDALMDHIHAEYSRRAGPRLFNHDGWFRPVVQEGGAPLGDSEHGTPSQRYTSPEHEEYSNTNSQEPGVGEADIVQTDGKRIFLVDSGHLVVVDAAQRRVASRTEIAPGARPELLAHGDSVLVIQPSITDSLDRETVVQRIDVSSDSPRIVETLRIQGEYVGARELDGVAHLVMSHSPLRPPDPLPIVYAQSPGEEEAAKAHNRDVLLATTIDDWLPRFTLDGSDAASGSRLTPCQDVYAPALFSNAGVTTVVGVAIDDTFNPEASVALTAPSSFLYVSPESLHVAHTTWVNTDPYTEYMEGGPPRLPHSAIHSFDITDSGRAEYRASGHVPGSIASPFSLSELGGRLRVATTGSGPSPDNTQIRILVPSGGLTREVGSLEVLGTGELPDAVRFVGDVGYVAASIGRVASSHNDPLYSVDLSKPTAPAVPTAASPAQSGSVQHAVYVPAADSTVLRAAYDMAIERLRYTSYLHPLDDGLLLSVKNTTDQGEQLVGLEVAVHDVAQESGSPRLATWTMQHGRHSIGRDHRSFLWWASNSLAVVPIDASDLFTNWSAAVVLRVRDGEIEELARIVHVPDTPNLGQTDCRRLTEADLVPIDELSEMGQHESADTLVAALTEPKFLPDIVLVLLACGPDEGGMTGLVCYRYHYSVGAEAQVRARLGLAIDEDLDFCKAPRDSRRSIARAIVIGEELWTLSYYWIGEYESPQLQVNDLGTLEHLAVVYP